MSLSQPNIELGLHPDTVERIREADLDHDRRHEPYYPEDLPQRLQDQLNRFGLTAMDASKDIGVDVSVLYRFLQGRYGDCAGEIIGWLLDREAAEGPEVVELPDNYAAIIRNVRAEHGIKQVDLSEMSGVSQSFISRVELGKTAADSPVTQKVWRALQEEGLL